MGVSAFALAQAFNQHIVYPRSENLARGIFEDSDLWQFPAAMT